MRPLWPRARGRRNPGGRLSPPAMCPPQRCVYLRRERDVRQAAARGGMGGRLFLHIGRNRAGSTTLQSHWLRNVDALLAQGVQYALFGQASPPGLELQSFSSHMELAAHLRRHPDRSILISHEGLCCFQRDFAKALASDLASLDLQVLFYVRPYRGWAVSDYSFNVLIGWQTGSFDDYLETLGGAVSFWPALEVWGEAVGWDRVRVRSLHPGDLVGGDLICDGMAAIGLPPLAHAAAPRENATPNWVSVELVRALLAEAAEGVRPADRFSTADILTAGERIDHQVRVAEAVEGPVGRAAYLTQSQSLSLATLYNDDLARVADRTGVRLSPDSLDVIKARPFLPSAARVPYGLRRSIQRSLLEDIRAGSCGPLHEASLQHLVDAG